MPSRPNLQAFRSLFTRLTAGRVLDEYDDRHVQLPLSRQLRGELERAITRIRWVNPAAYESFAKHIDYTRLQTILEFY